MPPSLESLRRATARFTDAEDLMDVSSNGHGTTRGRAAPGRDTHNLHRAAAERDAIDDMDDEMDEDDEEDEEDEEVRDDDDEEEEQEDEEEEGEDVDNPDDPEDGGEEGDEEEGEEGEGEEDEDDGGYAEFFDMWQEDQWLEVLRLRRKVVSLTKRANASNLRGEHVRHQRSGVRGPAAAAPGEEEGEAALQKRRLAMGRQHRRLAEQFQGFLKKKPESSVPALNRVLLSLSAAQREGLRELGFLRQEWFLATRGCVKHLQKHLYTAEASLEMRLSECISIRAFRRMRRVLTHVQDSIGQWGHLVLMDAPKHKNEEGGDPSLTKKMNADLGIYPKRPVYAPTPIAGDAAIQAAAERLLEDRKMAVAIPSTDGFSGATWDILEVARDVFTATASVLRTHPAGSAARPLHRLWLGFDGLTWTKRNGLVRWCMRTPDIVTSAKLNDPKWAREATTYTGFDKNAGLIAASKIGGAFSIRQRLDAGVVVTQTPPAPLPAAVQEDPAWPYPENLQAALCYACEVQIPVASPGNQTWWTRVVQGGDRAAGHAGFACDSCIAREGVCMRCCCRKPGWTVAAECESAVRRTAVLQSVLCHVDPRPRMKRLDLPPFRCPCCDKEITPELMTQEIDEFSKLSAPQQKIAVREHSKKHHGAMKFEELVIFQDMKWRGSSNLHRRTNMAHNNVIAVFMPVAFDESKRLRANEAMEDAGMMSRFPTRSAKQRMGKLGNGDDARILHSNPTLLVRLFEIFYEDDPLLKTPEVQALLDELRKAAAAATTLVGPSKKSRPRKRTPTAAGAAATSKPKRKQAKKKKAPSKSKAPMQAGGSESAIAALAAQRAAETAAAAAVANPLANAATVEEAAAALDATVKRYDFGADASKKDIDAMVELTTQNLGEFASTQALSSTRANISDKATRIIALFGKKAPRKLKAFAAYSLNCIEGGKAVAYVYELQLDVDCRGQGRRGQPSLGKALLRELECKAQLSMSSGRLHLSVHELNEAAVGFYKKACGFVEIDQRTESEPGKPPIVLLQLEKQCGRAEEVEEEAEAQLNMVQAQLDADHDLEEHEEHEDAPADGAQVGDVKTAISVWHESVKFWAAISAPVEGEHGDYDQEKLRAYAQKGQAAGKAWALAIQRHSDNRCNWQYVHDTFAHVRCPPRRACLAPARLATAVPMLTRAPRLVLAVRGGRDGAWAPALL